MNRNLLWKFLLIVFVVAWAAYEIYPPTSRNVVDVFAERATRPDTTFSNILARAHALDKQNPNRGFANLRDAVGTNEIVRYFPQINTKGQRDPNSHVLHQIQQSAAGKIRLGLDLRGGTSFLVKMDTNQLARAEERQTALENAVEVLRKRVDKLGVAEPLIQPAGSDRILIQMPGLSQSDMEAARRQIERAAFLEFRMVHPNSRELIQQEIIEPGFEILKEERKGQDGTAELVPHVVNKRPATAASMPDKPLTGVYVKRAFVTRHHLTGEPEISFELTSEGALIFAEITRENVGRQLAIILDGELQSAPVIRSEIPGGNGVISGSFDVKEAWELANVLENPLEAPVKIIDEDTVDPSLGHDSITSGMTASLIGAACTFVFMLVFYFFVGFVANFALALNVLILMGIMASIGTTLTLPGIAGIALTIGMAVDANVLIYERLREELAAGKSLRGAIRGGYEKAFGTIFDSNLTTLISSVILIWMGSGPIKGFGVTLTIGLCVSMFTALLVTRFIFDFLQEKNLIKSIRLLPIMKVPNFNFMGWAKPAFVVSWLIILGGIGYGFSRGQEVWGVEFVGGNSLIFSFQKKVEVEQIRSAVNKLKLGDAMIQYQRNRGSGTETLRITTRSLAGEQNVAPRVEATLKEQFKDAGLTLIGQRQVGATVGGEIQRSAIISSLLALFGILVYVSFRYELSFAVGAVVALIHDVLLTLGIYLAYGGEFNSALVAAILTIIGYSINDKIVILDRIREDLRLGVRGSFKELINVALNQTLSRTMITGGSVLLATLSLLIFGGGAIKDLAFAFFVGVVAGTFSSLFIASPIVLWWNKGERPRTGTQLVTDAQTSTPARV